jgi:hypothetical protein
MPDSLEILPQTFLPLLPHPVTVRRLQLNLLAMARVAEPSVDRVGMPAKRSTELCLHQHADKRLVIYII